MSYGVPSLNVLASELKSLSQLRIRRDFRGKMPACGHFSAGIPELPIVMFFPEEDVNKIKGPGLNTSLTGWVEAVMNKRFIHNDGQWILA